ncbi:MAG: HD domain-containing phosphohydrolase [Phycisphaerae bacterium]
MGTYVENAALEQNRQTDINPRASALIVDDDAAIRRLCRKLLEREGWRVEEAADGGEAIRRCYDYPPDVIVMDIDMPKMDGLEATRQLRSTAATEGIPIVILSGHSDLYDVETILSAGADAFISKPVRPREFTLRIRCLSRLRRAWRELKDGREILGEQTRILSLLSEYSAALSRKEDLDSILHITVRAAADMTSCQRISIMLPDPRRDTLSIAASIGIEDHVIRNVKLTIGESIAGRVFATGQPIVINDQTQAGFDVSDRDFRVFKGLPMLSSPMSAAEKTIGVLNVTKRVGARPFEPSELGFLNLLTNYAASAVQNVWIRQARDEARDGIVVALAKLAEHRDDDTGKHLDRVTLFCLKLAEALRQNPIYSDLIDSDYLWNMERAVPLHDIGKVAIPDAILLKPGRLTESEMAVMRTHAEIGADTIRSLLERSPNSGFLRMAEEIAQNHHEWVNGKGYPRGLKGDEIPLSARIAALADVYDALTTKRVYKEAMSHRKALEIIVKESGSHFDPDIVKVFLKLEPEFERLAKELADADPNPPAHSTLGGDDPISALIRPREGTPLSFGS